MGSYCSKGASVSFKGVYSAPMGTTSRDASYIEMSIWATRGRGEVHTMRELGKVFQLRRTPSRSSISPHDSFMAS